MKYLQLAGQFDVKPRDPSYLKLQLLAKVFRGREVILNDFLSRMDLRNSTRIQFLFFFILKKAKKYPQACF